MDRIVQDNSGLTVGFSWTGAIATWQYLIYITVKVDRICSDIIYLGQTNVGLPNNKCSRGCLMRSLCARSKVKTLTE